MGVNDLSTDAAWLIRSWGIAVIATVASLGGANGTLAQSVPLGVLSDPPRAIVGATAGEVEVALGIRLVEGSILNPYTQTRDRVSLRNYVDLLALEGSARPVGPTIEVRPGETLRLTLSNQLSASDPSCPSPDGDINTPHCFNSTNMHTHGMWVSPSGNSDNVMIGIEPGVTFEYEYAIPADHPSGTFWYHPHMHGSTAIQVGSGMSGALIVRGERLPTPTRSGDIDTLLAAPGGAVAQERILLFQQIQYACFASDGTLEQNSGGSYHCDPEQVGELRNYDGFGPVSWAVSGRHTSINGMVLPRVTEVVEGQIERWRLVHAGVRDTISFELRRFVSPVPPALLLGTDAHRDFIAENCADETLESFVLASDGLTRSQLSPQSTVVLQPGYREDLLVMFPQAGTYCMVDAAAKPTASVSGLAEDSRFLGFVEVTPGAPVAVPAQDAVTQRLVAAARRTMPDDMVDAIVADLERDLSLAAFVPHEDVEDAEIAGYQELSFSIDISGDRPLFLIDGNSYAPDRIDRVLPLGAAEQWRLTSGTNPPVGHPFHIHVNPFQIHAILDPDGQDVSVSGEPDDPQYAGLNGVWRDTVFVKPGYQVIIRTRYRRYIGQFVLHCHILDHEDQGMMQNVSIVIPSAAGGVSHGHGHH